MSIDALPFNVYKANIALQLRITQLLQECRQRWLEAAQQRNADATAQTAIELEDVSQSSGWQSLASLSPETYGRLFQVGTSGSHAISETVIRNQAEFAAGLQQALQEWQKTVSVLFGGEQRAQTLPDITNPPAEPATSASPGRATKGGVNR